MQLRKYMLFRSAQSALCTKPLQPRDSPFIDCSMLYFPSQESNVANKLAST